MRTLQDNNNDRYYSIQFAEYYAKLILEISKLDELMENCEKAAGKLIGNNVGLLISSDMDILFVSHTEDMEGGHEIYYLEDILRAIRQLADKHKENGA